MKYFITFALMLFVLMGFKTYEQYKSIKDTEELIILNKGKSLADFTNAFHKTYQDAFVTNNIEIDNKTINLLPIKQIRGINKYFSSTLDGDIIVRTVSDRPRNVENMANEFELNIIKYFKEHPKAEEKFIREEDTFYYTKPIRIRKSCLTCHGKREDAITTVRDNYEAAYDYELDDIRGLLNIKIKKSDFFDTLYDEFINNLIINIIIYIAFLIIIYILLKKMRLKDKQYTKKLEVNIQKKTAEIKKQKEVFETLFEKSSNGISILEDNKIVKCNEKIVKMLEYNSKEELLNKHPSVLSPEVQPDGRSSYEKAQEMIATAVDDGFNQFEWVHTKANGENFWAEITLVPIILDNRELIHVVWRDISKRKKAQDEIKHLNENLQEEVNSQIEIIREKDILLTEQFKLAQMGEMMNMIAHQWRQPLNAMSASAIHLGMLNEFGTLKEEDVNKTIHFIQKQTQKMSGVINDFMKFNSVEDDKVFLLLDVVLEVYKVIEAQLINRSIEVKIDIDKNLKVYHNKKAIEHALINLIVNARDAFEEPLGDETKNILIYAKRDVDNVLLSIEDNAGGIPKDIINKIFNPYFTTKEEGKGTGIGLYMTRKMIKSVNESSINVESIDGKSIFTIKFKNHV